MTDNSKKSITYSFRTNVKILFPENVILKYWKTICCKKLYKLGFHAPDSYRDKKIKADFADNYIINPCESA